MKIVGIACLVVLTLIFSTGTAFAQDTPVAGAFVGFNRSWFSVSQGGDSSAKTGLMGGAFAVLLKDKAVKIQPEFQITQRDAEVSSNGVKSTYSTTYASIGVMMRNDLWGLYTTVGPQFMFPMKATISNGSQNLDVKGNTNSDVSMVAGLGKQFDRFAIEARWDSGFKEIEDFPLGLFVKRNRALTFLFSVGF